MRELYHDFMNIAIEEAKKGLKEGGIPIGSVLINKDGKILGKGHNRRVQDNDPLAHAEIVAIRNAGRIKSFKDTILFSTLMPCFFCAGAIVQFGIKKVIVGESKTYSGAKDFLESHGVEVIDLDLNECKELMEKFINEKPELWHEDIGEL